MNEKSSKSNTKWVFSNKHSEQLNHRVASKELVIAWAKDKLTGEPKYILELTKDERGAKCNCICASCELPLTAINAGKKEYKIRPHFRHPDGAQRDSCIVLSARFAIAQQLLKEGFIDLPRRRRSASVEGLSGKFHEAWVELPPERVQIKNAVFNDKVTAVLTLGDGRQLMVELTGSLQEQDDDQDTLIPTISLDVSDPAIASMPPDELRRRLTLTWAGACWHNHWKDLELINQAAISARQKASEALDWLEGENGDDLVGLSQDQRKETLLHREVKAILEREKKIHLPEFYVNVERVTPRREHFIRETHWSSEYVYLENVRLENKLGRVVPDVLATVVEASKYEEEYELVIEVTVTNNINEERLKRIRETNLPTLEIDIGRMGGRVTREELVMLVVDEVAGKRWLHHPKTVSETERFNEEIDIEINRLLEREQLRERSLEIAPAIWSERFLTVLTSYCNLRESRKPEETISLDEQLALDSLEDIIYALVLHGYPEVRDIQTNPSMLMRVLERLLSIKTDTGVGYKLTTGWQVINTIHLDGEKTRTWHSLFLIAIKLYKPDLNNEQDKKVKSWRKVVVDSIQSKNSMYLRSTKYDALLCLLFPEMRDAIRNGFGAQPSENKTTNINKKNYFSKSVAQGYKDTKKDDLWLKGRDLEEWKRKYPKAAKAFFGS